MAEFQEVMQQWERMCNKTLCCECNFYSLVAGRVNECRDLLIDHAEMAEKLVMAWAAEHLEPVYPTWAEWLHDNGIILDARQHDETEHWLLGIEAMKPIPADIAEKLGIEPKEVSKND